MASRWAAGSRRSAAIRARWSSGRSAYASDRARAGTRWVQRSIRRHRLRATLTATVRSQASGLSASWNELRPGAARGERLHHGVLGLGRVAGDADELADQARVRHGVHLAQPAPGR